MVARLVAVSKRARSSRSNSAAVRTRMPAALTRQRAASGKNGSCLWNCGNCLSTMPQTNTTGSTHCRASWALITWTTLRRPSSRRKGCEPENAFDRAPVLRDADLARGIERGRPLRRALRRRDRARWTGCATVAPSREWRARRAARDGRASRRVEKRAAQSFGVRAKARHSSSAASESNLWSRRSAPGRACPSSSSSSDRSSLRPALGTCSRTSKSKRSARGEIGEARGEAQDGQCAGVVPSTEHGLDGARQKAHRGVAFQGGIEIEAGGNSEALQGGAQCRRVDLGGPHDDAHLPEGTARLQPAEECGARSLRLHARDSAP